jgi:hypothetical protein
LKVRCRHALQEYLDAEEQYIAANLKEHLRDHALFTGFAPIKNPKIAIAVIVENAGSGSTKAAPLAKAVLDLAVICIIYSVKMRFWGRDLTLFTIFIIIKI